MGTVQGGARLQMIRKTLVRRLADGNANAADAVAAIWLDIAARIEPVIGARGVAVLFSRALYLTGRDIAWLTVVDDSGDGIVSFASFKSCLDGVDPDAASEAGSRLLLTFTLLLAKLIGEALSDRLLGPVWTASPPPSAPRQGS